MKWNKTIKTAKNYRILLCDLHVILFIIIISYIIILYRNICMYYLCLSFYKYLLLLLFICVIGFIIIPFINTCYYFSLYM